MAEKKLWRVGEYAYVLTHKGLKRETVTTVGRKYVHTLAAKGEVKQYSLDGTAPFSGERLYPSRKAYNDAQNSLGDYVKLKREVSKVSFRLNYSIEQVRGALTALGIPLTGKDY